MTNGSELYANMIPTDVRQSRVQRIRSYETERQCCAGRCWQNMSSATNVRTNTQRWIPFTIYTGCLEQSQLKRAKEQTHTTDQKHQHMNAYYNGLHTTRSNSNHWTYADMNNADSRERSHRLLPIRGCIIRHQHSRNKQHASHASSTLDKTVLICCHHRALRLQNNCPHHATIHSVSAERHPYGMAPDALKVCEQVGDYQQKWQHTPTGMACQSLSSSESAIQNGGGRIETHRSSKLARCFQLVRKVCGISFRFFTQPSA